MLIAAIARLLLIVNAQVDAGDSRVYATFAENIYRGCGLSHSIPTSNACVLTSAGYFPGYPFFMAAVWTIFGKSVFSVLMAQVVCYAAAIGWLCHAIMRLTQDLKIVASVGLVLALSPLQVGWYRFILTEPLAIATATWLFAEIILSVANRKIRAINLAAALSASIYVRPDAILMFVAIISISFCILDFKKAIKQLLIVIVLISIPVFGWLIRNIAIGENALSMTTSAAPIAPGYFQWLDTWVVNEYERSDANFPVWRAEYSKINIHNSKYISTAELADVKSLLSKLNDGDVFPEEVSDHFYEIANQKAKSRGSFVAISLVSERVIWLLINPFSSWGLPLEIKSVDKNAVARAITSINIAELDQLLKGQWSAIFGKMASFVYRLILFLLFVYIVCNTIRIQITKVVSRSSMIFRVIVLACVSAVVARLVFFVSIGGLESRYLVEVVPWIECCCVMWCFGQMRVRISPDKPLAHGAGAYFSSK